jgi:hypothetical protein
VAPAATWSSIGKAPAIGARWLTPNPRPPQPLARSSAALAPIHRDVPAFSVVDAVTPVGAAPCAECRGAIGDTYYEADQSVICAACHARLTAPGARHMSDGRFARALAFGGFAAFAGAAGYIALLATTGRELTLALLPIGFVVGRAVRMASAGRGGRRFQWLAVTLTYLAIATTYVPFVVKGYSRQSSVAAGAATDSAPSRDLDARFLTVAAVAAPAPARVTSLGGAALGLGALLLLAIAAPMLESATHVAGALITLATLFVAWRMNRRGDVMITGPFRVRTLSA